VTDFFATVGEFDHLAITAGESLDLGEFAAVDLEKARRFFEVRFWGAVTAAKYAAKRIKSTGSIILTEPTETLPRVMAVEECTCLPHLKRFLKKSIQELASRFCAGRKLVSTLDLAKNFRLALCC
jgi:hypothetical protein